jgi:hypothetical protein
VRTLNILFLILASVILCGYFWSNSKGLANRVADLEEQVEELSAVLEFVYVETEEMEGLTGPHLIIEGANVHVRSGYGTTDDGCESDVSGFPNCEILTGLGNLIVGYNDRIPSRGTVREVRTGSHNLVVGEGHSFTSFGGFVAGWSNRVIGKNSSVTGGRINTASGFSSSICGGKINVASGTASSIGGGEGRDAPGDSNWAAGNLFESN